MSSHIILQLSFYVLPKSTQIFPDKILYPLMYLLILIAPNALQFVEDAYSVSFSAYFSENLLTEWFEWIVRLILAITGWLTIAKSHLLEENNE